jgi:hypothetical protein
LATCCIADFQIGRPDEYRTRHLVERHAGWETRDTADWEVCATNLPVRLTNNFGMHGLDASVNLRD